MTTLASAAPLSDASVVDQVRDGQVDMFEVLMRRHNEKLYRTVRSILKDDSLAEDVMQETYLRAFAHLQTFSGKSLFSTWLIRIGINEALMTIRKSRYAPKEAIENTDWPSATDNPESTLSTRQLISLLEKAVDDLPDQYRSVFVFRHVEGMSVAETAAALELTEEVVRVRAFRAHDKLRASLDRWVNRSPSELFRFLAPRCNRVVDAVLAHLRGNTSPAALA